MKKLLGMFAIAAALLFAGYSTVTPAAAASPTAQTSINNEKASVNTDVSAQRYWRRRYYAPRRYYRPRYYVAPRYYAPRYYAPRPYYYGW